MMLPKNRDNWTLAHAERAVKVVQKAFDEYERRYDADKKEQTDDLYMAYLRAEEEARDVIIVTNCGHLLKKLP